MIVCQCTGVTDAKLRSMIDNGVESLDDLMRRTGAGLCCAPCREEIAALWRACAATAPSVGTDVDDHVLAEPASNDAAEVLAPRDDARLA